MLVQALIIGGAFSLLLLLMISIIMIINPRYELHNWPKAVRDKVPAKTSAERRGFKMVALPLSLLYYGGFGVACYMVFGGKDLSLLEAVMYCFIALMITNLFDLLVMDFIICAHGLFKFWLVPGTSVEDGYKDYYFYFKGFLSGTVFSVAGALLLGIIIIL